MEPHDHVAAPTTNTSQQPLTCGARTWYFPDGYLPPKTEGEAVEAHEALMILNTTQAPARLSIDFYFEDREPVKDVQVQIGKERVKCIRLDYPEDLGGLKLPVATQYSIRVRSDVNILIQQGRIDTTQANMSYYGSMGFCE